MGAFSIWHWVIVLVIVLVLFGGRGKVSSLMGDFGKGLKSFKKNMKDEAASSSDDEEDKKISADATTSEETTKDTAAKS